MIDKTLLLPITIFLITNILLYMSSKDKDKKKKPLNFVIPGLIVSIGAYLFMKYSPQQEKMMEGNYFD